MLQNRPLKSSESFSPSVELPVQEPLPLFFVYDYLIFSFALINVANF